MGSLPSLSGRPYEFTEIGNLFFRRFGPLPPPFIFPADHSSPASPSLGLMLYRQPSQLLMKLGNLSAKLFDLTGKVFKPFDDVNRLILS